MSKHVAKRLDKENALHRGCVIELRSHIPATYAGRYIVGRKGYFTTQKEAKAYIDKRCLERGVDSFMDAERTKEFIAEW